MFIIWTDPLLFITNISPLTSWPLISKFCPVTSWPFAWWPLAPASLTDDVGHHDLWHQHLSPDRPSASLTFHPTDLRFVTFDITIFDTIIFDLNDFRLLNLSFLRCEFRAMFIILDRPTCLHHWYFTFEFLAFHFQVLTCDPMTFCLMAFSSSIFDRWWWTPWLMTQRSFTSPTFDSTHLSPYRPSTRDLWHYDLWHHNLWPEWPSTSQPFIFACDFPAMFIILDRSTPLHHWYFTFAFLAFDFQVLTCDLMTFCLMTFGTSIFHRWWWTPWLMTQRSFTSPTFDSTNLSPYRPSTSDLWHYDHNYTIIFDLSDLRHLNLSFLTCEFHAMLLFWTDPRIFITDISPLTSWPLIFKFWPVTPWGFAWWPLVPACLTHDVGHHDLWHQDLSPDRPSTPLTFRLTDLRLHWPFPLRTFDPWPLTLRP